MIELRSQNSYLLKDRKLTAGNLMLTCINHADGNERKPSMGILTHDVRRGDKVSKAGSVNCFTCGYTADLAEFVSNCFGYADAGYFGHKWIISNFVNLSIENRRDIELDMSRQNTSSDAQKSILSDSELAEYRYVHPYMKERLLTDRVIEYFDVGYDREKKCLTFPVHDLNGDPVFMQRRAVKGKMFMNDMTTLKATIVYGLYHVYKNLSWIKELYITESIIDALTLWGYRKAAVATMQAIPTVTQLDLLKKVPVKEFICAQDMDDAGDKGAARIKKYLGDHKLIYRAEFDYKDVNKQAQKDDEQIKNMRKYIL